MGPISYISVDRGLIGLPQSPLDTNEDSPDFYPNAPNTIKESVTDTNELSTEKKFRGNVIYINLVPRLIPLIYYPRGDVPD